MSRRYLPFLGIALFCAGIFLFRAVTAGHNPITWDEPVYFNAARAYVNWGGEVLESWSNGQILEPFSAESINKYWERHLPSPPLAKTINGVAWLITRSLWGDLSALRAGSAFCYALLFALVIIHARKISNWVGACVAALILLVNPRLFFHAGTANLDTIGMVFAYLSLYYFYKTAEQRGWKFLIVGGILWGLAFAAKNSALLVFPVFVLWAVIWIRRRDIFIRLAGMQLIAFITLLLVWPWLWHDTAKHLYEFGQFTGLTGLWEQVTHPVLGEDEGPITENRKLTRTFGAPNTGLMVDDKRAFPWYYAVRVLFAVTPAPTLILFFLGCAFAISRIRKPEVSFIILGALLPVVLTSLPFFPIYDMERFLLICFPFAAVTAGYGVAAVLEKFPGRKKMAAVLAVILLAYLPTFREWRYLHPLELSYFNAFVGGLRGAVEKGYPRTYWLQGYWAALPYLNSKVADGSAISAEEDAVLVAYQQFGLLKRTLRPTRIFDRVKVVEKIDVVVRQLPINEERAKAFKLVDKFELHQVPIVSVFKITPRYLKFVARKEQENRRKKAEAN